MTRIPRPDRTSASSLSAPGAAEDRAPRKWRQALGWLLAALLFLPLLYIAAGTIDWKSLGSLSPTIVSMALFTQLIGFGLTILAFHRLWRLYSPRPGFSVTSGIWILTSFASYIPGRVLVLGGRAALIARHLPAKNAFAIVFLETAATLGSVILASLPVIVRTAGGFALAAPVILVAAALFSLLVPPIAARFGAPPLPLFRETAVILALELLACLAFGTGYWFLLTRVVPGYSVSLLDTTAFFALSWLAGTLAVVTPSGLGVSDLTLAGLFVLNGVEPSAAAAGTVLIRVLNTLGQLGMAAFLPLTRPMAAPEGSLKG